MGPYKQKGIDFGAGTGSNPESKPSRKADRQAKRATKKTTRQANKATKKAAIDAMPGTTKLEKKMNYAGAKTAAKDKARRDKRVKKKDVVTQASRKIETPKAAKPGVVKPTVKKTIKKVQTKRGTGVTYKAAWDADKGGVKSKYKNYEAFRKAAVAYNSRKDSTGVMKSDANKMGPKNKK